MLKGKKKMLLEKKWKKIALERVKILEEMKKKKPEFAERYEELIERIKKKCKLQVILLCS